MRFKRDDVRLGVEIKLKTFLKNCGKVLALFGSPPSVPALSASRCGPGARAMLLDLPSGDSVSVALLARSSPFDAPSTSGRSSVGSELAGSRVRVRARLRARLRLRLRPRRVSLVFDLW